MSIFNFGRRSGSARVALERLALLLSHERRVLGQPELLAILREEILAVVANRVVVEHDDVEVRVDRGKTVSTLEISVKIRHPIRARRPPTARP